MANDLVWRLKGEQALLVCGSWQARVDASRPAAGLSDVSYQGLPLSESTFLGVDLDVGDRAVVGDCHQRGDDLIVRYPQTGARPFAVVVYWRAGWFRHAGQSHPRIDLLVSVETNLLDSRPRLSAVSDLTIAARPLAYYGGGYLLAAVGEVEGLQGSGPKVHAEICYAEMCHPGDLISMSIETPERGGVPQDYAASASGRQVRCLTRLFGQPLEKGVILRSRMRGLFVPRERSDEIAQAALAELAGSAPPLTA